MEMAFINAILRSPTFPPNDPWLSGYGISYYYFGYVLAAMLIRVSGVDAAIGYNLMSALWFALTALGAYGVLFDLLAGNQHEEGKIPGWIYTASLLAPLCCLSSPTGTASWISCTPEACFGHRMLQGSRFHRFGNGST